MADSNLIAGRFEKLEAIGAGAMGDVFKGRDTQTGDLVAIKALKPDVIKNDPQIIERFDREGEALRRLNHPSIVKVIATALDDDDHYLILEFVEGGSLRSMLDETPQLPIDQILEIALDLSDALARAHRLDIVHRDLKPANVLIANDGTPRLTDFGIARIGDTSQMTQTGVIMGTLAYLPPEALSGQRTDYRGDIWAFGVMLYEMCAGSRPFDGDNTGAILNGILNTEPPDMLQFREYEEFGSWGLPGLIYWMLEKEREKRPQSARLVGAMVENLLSGKEMPSYNWFGDTSGAYDSPTGLPLQPKEAAQAVRQYTTSGFSVDELNAELAKADSSPASTPAPVVGLDSQWTADPTISQSNWSVSVKRKIDHTPRLFISYRRSDSTAMTGRIHDRLTMAFGAENIFKDVMDIPAGADYKEVIHGQILASDVVLVMIGDKWTNAANENGRRLEQDDDVVRFEVATALANRSTLVIPVLVNNAEMPEERLLPPDIKSLVYHNAATVRHDPDFNRDVEWLINQISNAFEVKKPQRAVSPTAMAAIGGFVLAASLLVALVWLVMTGAMGSGGQASVMRMPESCNAQAVDEGEFMVLVAQAERISGDEREVQRFIVDDLTEHYEVAVPNSRYNIRASETVIRDDADARQLADLCDALVIIWGNYDDSLVEMNVQLGDLSAYPRASVVVEDIVRTITDARYELENERRETLAFAVAATLNGTWTATNSSYNVAEVLTITDIVTDPPATPTGSTTGARYHAFIRDYIDDPAQSITHLDAAINTNRDNGILAMLFIGRSLAHLRVGDNEAVLADITSARSLSPDGWAQPDFMMANYWIYGENDFEVAMPYIDATLEIIPDDWFVNSVRAAGAYILFDYETAQIHTDRALANDPQASFPYATATSLALRNGEFIKSQEMVDIVQDQYADATFAARLVNVTISEQATQADVIPFFVGFGNLALGRWNDALEITDFAIESGIEHPDIYFLRGFAQCNLEQYEAAEASYTQALELDPEFYFVYLLRAEVKARQGIGRGLEAIQDLTALQQSPQSEIYEPFTSLGITLLQEVGCETMLEIDLTLYGVTQ